MTYKITLPIALSLLTGVIFVDPTIVAAQISPTNCAGIQYDITKNDTTNKTPDKKIDLELTDDQIADCFEAARTIKNLQNEVSNLKKRLDRLYSRAHFAFATIQVLVIILSASTVGMAALSARLRQWCVPLAAGTVTVLTSLNLAFNIGRT